MHILIGLLIVLCISYLLYRAVIANASVGGPALRTSPEATAEAATLDVAFVSDGKLFYRKPGQALAQLHSQHIQEAIDRRERSKQRNSWKEGTSFNVSANGGMRSFGSADAQIEITSAVFDEHKRCLLYCLRDEAVGGLFSCDPGSNTEQRILLKQQLHLDDLGLSPDGQMLCASSVKDDGIANIAIVNRDGSQLREVTGGDTFDASPAWVPDAPGKLLFQSSGFARNERGAVVAQSPSTIQMLDMQSGTVSPVLEDAMFDFINPRVCPEGNLLFIRRPYDPPRYGTENLLLDTLLFPFRLLRAVFHYLNFFSLMYSRKPLTSASGPAVNADIKDIILQGKRINAEKLMRQDNTIHGVPSLVPRTWELVSRTPQGIDRVLATHVASYDIDTRGRIVYSNGRGVFVLGKGGSSALVLKSEFIADVFAAQLQPSGTI